MTVAQEIPTTGIFCIPTMCYNKRTKAEIFVGNTTFTGGFSMLQ
jgi:hypothetical protein